MVKMNRDATDTEADQAPMSTGSLRADARRNVERIRAAAIEVFRRDGLTVPLEDIARAAGVSKGTLFNRFGGRAGLIDAVIQDAVAQEFSAMVERAETCSQPEQRIVAYLRGIRTLQYDVPAFNDVVLQVYPQSSALVNFCGLADATNARIVAEGRQHGVLRADLLPADLQALAHETAYALTHGPLPDRDDYDRRTEFVIDGLRARG